MVHRWGATGVGRLGGERLSSGCGEHIQTHLESQGFKGKHDALFSDLDRCFQMFHARKRIAAESSPAQTKANLNRALERALKLNDAVNKLDGNSWQFLAEATKGDVSSFCDAVKTIFASLQNARRISEAKSPRGKLHQDHRYFLAADIADAIRTHLSVKLTSNNNGLFCNVLGSVLDEIAGKETGATCHELARKVLNISVKVHGDGDFVEYIPPDATK